MAFSLLLADKDPQVLSSLRTMIKKCGPNMEIWGAVQSGTEAWDFLLSHRPDAIIMESNLPDLNVFEVIDKLNQHQLAIRVIIHTDCRAFSFAQKALNSGVYAWLMKPTDQKELAFVLDRLSKDCTHEFNAQKGTTLYAVQLLLQGGASAQLQFDSWRFFDGLPSRKVRLCLIQFEQPQSYDKYRNYMKIPVSQAYYLRPLWVSEHYWIIIFKTAVIDGAPRFRTLMRPFEHVNYHVAFSDDYECTQLPQAYRQVKEAVMESFYTPKTFLVPAEVPPFHLRDTLQVVNRLLEEGVSRKLNLQTCEEVKNIIRDYFATAKTEHISPALLCAEQKELFLYLHKQKSYISPQTEMLLNQAVAFFRDLEKQEYYLNYETLRNLTLTYIEDLTQLCEQAASYTRSQEIVYKAQRYCEKHLAEEISLQTISEEVYVSKAWFCTLFKRETGESFGNYLTRIRMNRAKTLLITTPKKVKQIAEAVGYPSLNHFNHVFSQKFGSSPLEYRRTHSLDICAKEDGHGNTHG